MSSAALARDPFMPRPPKGRGPALALALLAHALLIAALAFGVHWRNTEPTTLAAELWSAVPQAAAPRAVEPPPVPTPAEPEVKKAEPVVQPARPNQPARPAEPVLTPKPQVAPLPDPQIAIEQARRAAAKRALAEREEAEREKSRIKEEQAQKLADANKLKAEKLKVEKLKVEKAEKVKAENAQAEKADAARLAAAHDAYVKRMLGQAGATGGATDTGSALRSSGPSASYAGRIMARIKPNIVLTENVDGNPKAVVEVKLGPDGTIIAKRLVKSSGVKVWDDAVLRAIDRTEVLPRDIDGRAPPQFEIGFTPRD